jgi:transposase-like protein
MADPNTRPKSRAKDKTHQDEQIREKVREEYENTDAAVQDIATRYNIRSDTTIHRWKHKYGWVRNLKKIRATTAVKGVKGTEFDTDAHPLTPAEIRLRAQMQGLGKETEANKDNDLIAVECVENPDSHTEDTADSHIEEPESHTAPAQPTRNGKNRNFVHEGTGTRTSMHARAVGNGRIVDIAEGILPAEALAGIASPEDLATETVLSKLADLHARAVGSQLHTAQRMRVLGFHVLENMSTLMLADPPGPGEEENQSVQNATKSLQRLIKVAPERETLKGLIEATTKLLASAVDIERKALGLGASQTIKPGEEQGPVVLSQLPETHKMVLDNLPESALLSLRTAAVEIGRLQQQPGAAPVGTEAPVMSPPPPVDPNSKERPP